MIPTVIGTLGTVSKGLEKRLRKTIALLRSARMAKIVLETCHHSASSERSSAKAGVKNSQEVK